MVVATISGSPMTNTPVSEALEVLRVEVYLVRPEDRSEVVVMTVSGTSEAMKLGLTPEGGMIDEFFDWSKGRTLVALVDWPGTTTVEGIVADGEPIMTVLEALPDGGTVEV